MITEDYVSFEVAKLLKEKGFNEKCIATYNLATGTFKVEEVYQDWTTRWKVYVSAPTLQMTMKWLREVHNLHIIIECGYGNRLMYFSNIKNALTNDSLPNDTGYYSTYEQACEATIKYCLENLI